MARCVSPAALRRSSISQPAVVQRQRGAFADPLGGRAHRACRAAELARGATDLGDRRVDAGQLALQVGGQLAQVGQRRGGRGAVFRGQELVEPLQRLAAMSPSSVTRPVICSMSDLPSAITG